MVVINLIISVAHNEASLSQVKDNRRPLVMFVNVDIHLRVLLIEGVQTIALVLKEGALKEALSLLNVLLDTIVESDAVELVGNQFHDVIRVGVALNALEREGSDSRHSCFGELGTGEQGAGGTVGDSCSFNGMTRKIINYSESNFIQKCHIFIQFDAKVMLY